MTLPSFKTMTRSARLASSMSCVIEIMVKFSSSFNRRISPTMSLFPSGSSMLVDSSKIMIFGLTARTPAIATRCFCPPERRTGSCFANAVISTASKTSLTRFCISARGIPLFSMPNATSPSTSAPTNWLSGFWKTMPMRSLTSQTVSSVKCSPSTSIAPDSGISRPSMHRAKVDLPLPL